MSQLKPPSGQQLRPRSTAKRAAIGQHSRFDARISDVSVLKRRNADLQRRIATQRRVDNKTARQTLLELLASMKEEAEKGIASRGAAERSRKSMALANSTPELAAGQTGGAGRRPKLRKSLSLSGSRMLFHNFLNTIRVSSKRRSRSQDSIFDLAYLDQDQQVVRKAARQAQQRRSPSVRSLSAEPRAPVTAVTRDPAGRRPEPADKFSRRRRPQCSAKAAEQIRAFERLISNYLQYNLPSTNL
ncbi:uncharacterized protein LOC135947929 [Cloeon dipterum]|uniref:uncharacterized protein LOC135947929 n=1 Tax=Cloeon dipterum TaxID=197152 RepID=UPI00321F6A32